MSKGKLIILGILVLAISAGYYFRDSFLSLYDHTARNLQTFQKSDFGNLLSEIKRDIFTSSPLNVGGNANNVVLVKERVIAETNIQRYNNGMLKPLFESEKLNAAALAKAQDMFNKQYFEHVSPDGIDPGQLVKNAGYSFIVTGENLILGNFTSEREMVQLWMDSPGHRANILNDRFSEIGVAVVKGIYKGQTVWIGVQEFGLPLSACAPEPSVVLKNRIDGNKITLDDLALQIEAKRAEINRTNPRHERYNELVEEHNALVARYNALNAETKAMVIDYNSQIKRFNDCVAGKKQ